GLVVHPDAVGTFRVLVTVPAGHAPAGSKSITFTVHDSARARRASHDAVFVGPGR
ncbi:MAG: cytochrome c oxidase accessory protein CcoG, partial [Alphaproteobacteria bacterium]|nr:cytochrome c oxidase accessory protein CcoG [Alphaproteobacteria bacterium]